MCRLLIAGTIIAVTALLLGSIYFPNDPFMWLASTSTTYEFIRGGLLATLIILFFSNPPRAIYFRIFLAVCAASLGLGTLWMLSNYEMSIVDAVIFIEVAIIFGLEALESVEDRMYAMARKRSNALT